MIHILTLSWNGLDKLKKLKTGLYNNIAKLSEDVIWHIRDNGSNDGTVEEVSAWDYVKAYRIDHNRDSFSVGMNYLFEQASPQDDDRILLLNNDIEMPNDNALYEMSLVKAEAVGCLLLYPGGTKIQHAGVMFSKKYACLPWHYRAGELVDDNARKLRCFQAVTAACALVSVKAFREVGLFDTGYRWSFEDVDLMLKINKRKKGNVVMCGRAVVEHEESASLKKNPVHKMFMNSNVQHFRNRWNGKYDIDHDKYLNDPKHNEVKD